MPNFKPDLTKVQANFTIFPKGEYEFKCGEPSAFLKEKTDAQGQPTGVDSYGVRLGIAPADPGMKGKQMISLYMHSEGAQQFSKRFVMAALGYEVNEASERQFDADYAGADWSLNTDTKAVGDLWRQLTGQHVIIGVDIQKNNRTGEPMQQFTSYRPVAKRAAAVA